MARRKDLMDIRVILTHIQAGSSNRQIERDLRVDRRTVKRYREWAEEQELLEGELPEIEQLQRLLEETLPDRQPPQNVSTVEPYREIVEKLVKEKVEAKAIYHRLEERGFEGSYSAVYRFVRRFRKQHPEATVRVERPPGEEAQVDFGYAGKMIDPESGKQRRTWAFVMTLSWSRHQYIEFVFDQKIETWLRCHRNALAFFGGVPQRVVIDNLKAAIVKAIQDDPQVQHSYQECALHYGFLIAPCRVRTPEHKGKVEQGGVHYVKRNFLGGREPTTITQANQDVLVWCNTTAGLRRHGTTKEQPLKRFEETEKARLNPLPETPYDIALWKQLKLRRDCYIEFDKSYYSAPHRLIGQELWVCGGVQQVRIFDQNYHLIATHERADKPGTRRTHHDHLPPEKLPGLLLNREVCQATAIEIGPATTLFVLTLLDDPVLDRLPTVGRLLRLRLRYSDERLEAACMRALAFGDPAYSTVKGILSTGSENQPLPEIIPPPPATAFVRDPEELFGASLGGETWN
ncbi:MAG: IS21 family transposase [Chloroflexi bacterium]|nr:IS21 family transposase [Chloroflexota bacterium]